MENTKSYEILEIEKKVYSTNELNKFANGI